ncbi:hypothetical protein [Curtobacterium sp. ZW137]|uniref:hypothetical protein n=1 Tax=Curtobacterium sp. ZW137 TaxID=2485104 RepID=UPI000F4D154E|nr:hypothetical protein [Curtobacterium sp. ZW137]ROP65060.1 hypothetical protein EDF55_1713 [Curtobacterium sp. ZW137]
MTDTHHAPAEVTLDTETIRVITAIEAEVVAPEQRAHLTWTRPDAGLWAANYAGYYGGTVDRQGTHFFVSDTFGQYVGDFRSLDEAQAALAERLRRILPGVVRPVA